ILPAALRHDNHANIFGLANDSQYQVGSEQAAHPATLLRPANQYLCDLIAVGEINDALGGIIAFQSPALDVKVPGEVQVLLDRLDVLGRQRALPVVPQYAACIGIPPQV